MCPVTWKLLPTASVGNRHSRLLNEPDGVETEEITCFLAVSGLLFHCNLIKSIRGVDHCGHHCREESLLSWVTSQAAMNQSLVQMMRSYGLSSIWPVQTAIKHYGTRRVCPLLHASFRAERNVLVELSKMRFVLMRRTHHWGSEWLRMQGIVPYG